jgi:hypothetical protein
MKFTNYRGLPSALHQFLTYNDYALGAPFFNISCTKLIDSPQIAQHWRESGNLVEEDSATRVYSAMGSGIHSRFEQANASNADVLMEKRFLGTFPHPLEGQDPLVVSGQIDTYEFATKTLADLKTVSVWKIIGQDYASFEKQLNVCALLMSMNGFEVEKLQVYALIRDWSKGRTGENEYPNSNIQVIDIKMWTRAEQEAFVAERLNLHYGEGEKVCTDAETWAKPATYAVKGKGRKRAFRLLPTLEKAESWMASQGKGDHIEERPATHVRCESYCPFGKMGVCNQYKNAAEAAQLT